MKILIYMKDGEVQEIDSDEFTLVDGNLRMDEANSPGWVDGVLMGEEFERFDVFGSYSRTSAKGEVVYKTLVI